MTSYILHWFRKEEKMEKDKYMKESVVFSKLAAFLTPTDVIRARILLAQIPAEDVVEIWRWKR